MRGSDEERHKDVADCQHRDTGKPMLRGSLIALQGTLIAQGIGFAFLPLLTRSYTPEDFSAYQVYMSVLMLVLVAASLRYEVSLLSAAKGEEERAVLRLCGYLNIATAIVVLLALVGATTVLEHARSLLHGISPVLLAAGVLAGGLFQTLTYILLREQALGVNAVAKVSQIAVFCLLGLAAASLTLASGGLVASDVISRSVAVAIIAVWMLRGRRHYFRPSSPGSIASAARTYRKYPLYTVPGGLLSVAISSTVPLLMLAVYGRETMGQFALVERSILMPASILGQSVAQAFTAALSEAIQNNKHPIKEFRRVVLIMALLGAFPALILFFYGQPLFETIFGAQWTEAGRIAEVASILVVANLTVAPVNMTLLVMGHQKQQLAWEISRLASIFALWGTLMHLEVSPVAAIGLHATVMVAMSLAFLYLANRALRAASTASMV